MKNVFLWVIESGGILFIVKRYEYNEALRAYAKFCKRIETRRKVTAFFSNVQIKQKKYQSLLQNNSMPAITANTPRFAIRNAKLTNLIHSRVIVECL